MFSEFEEKMENDHKKARDQELKELAERVSPKYGDIIKLKS